MGVLESYLAGREARRVEAETQRVNAMQQFMAENGQAIYAGDNNALGQLAQYDPMAALQLKATHSDMARVEKADARGDQEWQMKVEEWNASKTAAEREAEAARLEGLTKQAIVFHQAGDAEGYAVWAQQNGVDVPFEQVPQAAAQYMSIAELMKPKDDRKTLTGPDDIPRFVDTGEPVFPGVGKSADPQSTIAKIQADVAAGLIAPEMGDAAIQKELAKSGMTFRSTPGGGTELVMGDGGDAGKVGKPTDPVLMIQSIDGILTDPALDFATGWMAWTQKIPGTEAKRFEGRAKQLGGQAFLQAFESLKGAGQITELEGAKATEAIGRLDTAQKPEDYRAALLELRQTLYSAAARPPGWLNTPEGQAERQSQVDGLAKPPTGTREQGAPAPLTTDQQSAIDEMNRLLGVEN